jgi:hypothetical protein
MTKVVYEIVEHDGGWAYRVVDGVYSRSGARGEGTSRSGRDDRRYPTRTAAGGGTTKFRKAPIGKGRASLAICAASIPLAFVSLSSLA